MLHHGMFLQQPAMTVIDQARTNLAAKKQIGQTKCLP
jgi:hypothetical protein